MRVLVTGANGFLGRHVVARLLERGHEVRAVVRASSEPPPWGPGVHLVRGDLRTHPDLASALHGVNAVIHLAAALDGDEDQVFASTVIGTERLVEVMSRSPVRRLVLASSLVVYDWAKARGTMDEETPLAADVYGSGAYTLAKCWQERVALRMAKECGVDLTVLRPGFVWGRGHAEIAGMGRIVGPAYIMIGPTTRLPLVHVENCADCFVTATEKPAAIGQVFNVVDGDDVRVWRYAREHARRSARRAVPIPVPYWFGLAVAHLAAGTSRVLFGRRGRLPSILNPRRFEAQFKPLRFSNRRVREVLGWSPPLPFEACLARTYGPA